MNRISQILIIISALFAIAASAAIFDTLESFDTLKRVAAQKQTTDRLPAAAVSETKDETDQAKPDASTPPAP